jgi:DNA mismatch endonuclease (patch repair protein)
VVFVHGCFWHQHSGCSRAFKPATHSDFWRAKLEGNVSRDKRVQEQLEQMGWHVKVIWECETKDPVVLRQCLVDVVLPSRKEGVEIGAPNQS